ncbi:MAG: hypothetical protein KME43_16405 [Myxacorys chilensis ATA2-1-KO14]|jgi:hypothetical protein|nr:hypothetical protein [Myxacorys chilensis ATA2-1-KO14]
MFTDLQTALVRARERAAATSADDIFLTELLELSAGTSRATAEKIYRPFYVAARYLQQSRRDQTIKQADGATFTGQAIPIASLLDLQRSLDESLLVPIGFEAIGRIEPDAKALKATYDAALLTLKKYSPRV